MNAAKIEKFCCQSSIRNFPAAMRTILGKTKCRTIAEQQISQFYHSFGRSMRTILRKTQCGTLAEQTADNRTRNFTTVSDDPCARSYAKHNAEHSRSSRNNRNRNFTTVSGDRCARWVAAGQTAANRNRNFTTVLTQSDSQSDSQSEQPEHNFIAGENFSVVKS